MASGQASLQHLDNLGMKVTFLGNLKNNTAPIPNLLRHRQGSMHARLAVALDIAQQEIRSGCKLCLERPICAWLQIRYLTRLSRLFSSTLRLTASTTIF